MVRGLHGLFGRMVGFPLAALTGYPSVRVILLGAVAEVECTLTMGGTRHVSAEGGRCRRSRRRRTPSAHGEWDSSPR